MKTLSVIIPVYNDLAALKRLIGIIRCWDQQPDEILVVVSCVKGCECRCEEFCQQKSVKYIKLHDACRGKQLQAGAAEAKSEIYWFLHADAIPDSRSPFLIKKAIENGASGGCFKFEFSGINTFKSKLFQQVIWLRSKFGVPYGDQGLFFSAQAYKKHGGIKPYPLFEEVELVKRVKQTGKFNYLEIPLGVDPRKWEKDGWFKRSFINRVLAFGYWLGFSPKSLAALYYKAKKSKVKKSKVKKTKVKKENTGKNRCN